MKIKSVATINIQLDEDAARIYTEASEAKRKKLRLLLSLWLREFEEPSSLSAIMDEISTNAEERGLTANKA